MTSVLARSRRAKAKLSICDPIDHGSRNMNSATPIT
jgi:hypothetical protein